MPGPRTYEDDGIPTDLLLALLDGDWNADGDGLWGEVEDGVDLLPEVAVGRIAAGNATEAQTSGCQGHRLTT
jgi:hypothetical protein